MNSIEDRTRRIAERLRESFVDLYLREILADGVIEIYGASSVVGDALAEGRRLAQGTDVEIDHVQEVLCSQSKPFVPSIREVGEGTAKQPSPVNQDSRGVALFCDKAHEHDWGDYDPLPPIA